jgi:phage shock protein A
VDDARRSAEEAMIELRVLAGRALARKEQAEHKLETAKGQKARIDDDLALALDGGEEALAAEIVRRKEDLEREISARSGEAAQATLDYDAVLAEMKSLGRSVKDLGRAELLQPVGAAKIANTALDDSTEAEALRNVRAHAANLEAQVKLNDELSGRPRAPEVKKPSAEEQLAALKAARKKAAPPAPAAAQPGAPSDPETPDPPKRSKRTM